MSSAGSLQLVVVQHGCLARCSLPRAGSVRIGRSDACEVVLTDPATSRVHALLHVGSSLELEDLGSHNGTRVRNHRLVPGQRTSLELGDSIQVANTMLIVQHELGPVPSLKGSGLQPVQQSSRKLIVRDEAMFQVYERVRRVAASSLNILILGETGVGKEVVAEAIHRASGRRSSGPFVRVNCAALSESLVESELFGHRQGAFTGAVRDKPGLLEAADKGTVFLDEVGELPLAVQAKLLRAIDSREVTRVGALKPVPVDVRFVAATNRDLKAEVQCGAFREDLFFRLNGMTIAVPPLRERPLEIEPLAATFAACIASELERPTPHFDDDVRQHLLQYPWPGNIRELRNVVECAVLLSNGPAVELSHLRAHPCGRALVGEPAVAVVECPERLPIAGAPQRDLGTRQAAEREQIVRALLACNGNQSRAAKHLGMPRRTLVTKLAVYDIPRPRKSSPPNEG